MPLRLFFLTRSYVARSEDIKEGISYRYVGLYRSLIDALFTLEPESCVYWYSVADGHLRIITNSGITKRKMGMARAVLYAISKTIKEQSYLSVILAYPSVLPRILKISEYASVLLLLKLFCSFKQIHFFVDDFDPPVEAKYAFRPKVSIAIKIYDRMMELVTLKAASKVIVLSDFWKQYMISMYRINEGKFTIVPNGSQIKWINYNSPSVKGPLTVLYAGSAMNTKDINNMVDAISHLNKKGLEIQLLIAGRKLMPLPEWVQIVHYPWPRFIDQILVNSDVCIIPYSPRIFTFNHSLPAKLFDYMAAGKPVLSTELEEVGRIVREFNCGIVFSDWIDFERQLERLYNDRAMAISLGKNGREAVKKHFVYSQLATSLLKKIYGEF